MDGTEADSVRPLVDLDFFESGDVVGVCPSVVLQKKVDAREGDYAGQMVSFIERLRAAGKKVLLVPHSVRTGTDKTHNNDLPLCTEINARLAPGDDLLFIDRELSSQQLRYLIGRCSLFVASRFHAMVSSLAMAVPTVVIGWSHKYREVLRDVRAGGLGLRPRPAHARAPVEHVREVSRSGRQTCRTSSIATRPRSSAARSPRPTWIAEPGAVQKQGRCARRRGPHDGYSAGHRIAGRDPWT